MFPINLVFHLIFDMKFKETSLPFIRLKYWLKKSGSVDPVDDEDVEEIVHELILQTSDNVRSKEKCKN